LDLPHHDALAIERHLAMCAAIGGMNLGIGEPPLALSLHGREALKYSCWTPVIATASTLTRSSAKRMSTASMFFPCKQSRTFPGARFLSRLLTALNLLPSIATLASAKRPIVRQSQSSPFRSAMSMLTFYLNRGGKNLSKHGKENLKPQR
jgi:Protein of unknown function (DUF3175)